MPSEPGMEKLHAEMLSLLKEFHKLCVENDIKYSLHAGTLLGAIREKGFIPWDDDIDVTITRDEYNKLLETLKRRSEEYKVSIQRIRKSPWLIPKYETEVPVWVDLLIYDYISERKLKQKCKAGLLMFLSAALKNRRTITATFAADYSKIKQIGYYTAYYLGHLFPFAQKLKLFDWVCRDLFCGNKTLIHRSNDRYCGVILVLPKEWMSEYILVPFEDTELMVTKNYHEVLVSSYGADYMTPKRMESQQSKVHDVARSDAANASRQRPETTGSEDK